MLMASSSAAVGTILPETGLIHQRAGNLAMGITVLEDLMAVGVLTLIGSLVQVQGDGGFPWPNPGHPAGVCHGDRCVGPPAASTDAPPLRPGWEWKLSLSEARVPDSEAWFGKAPG
jgi:hypothetical protein